MIRASNNLFLALVALLVAWPKYWLFPVGGIAVSPFTLTTMASIVVLIVLAALSGRVANHLAVQVARNADVFGLWFAWIVWRIIADSLGQTPAASMGVTLRTVVYSEAVLLLGLLPFSTSRVRNLLPVLLCVIAVGATLFGVYEYQVQRTLANIFNISFAGLAEDAAFNATRAAVEFFRDGAYRAASVFSHSIVFAQYMGAITPVALHLARFGRGGARLLGVLALACLPVALVISGARSGYVVAAISTATYVFVRFLGRRIAARRLLLLAGSAVVAGILFTSPIQSMIEGITRGGTDAEQSSSAARDEMITRGLYALQERALTGYGHGLAAEVAGLTGRNNIKTIDNYYLSTAVDFGYSGILLFSIVLLALIYRLIILINASPSESDADQARSYLAAAISIAVGQYIISIPDNLSLIFVFASVAMASTPGRPSPALATS